MIDQKRIQNNRYANKRIRKGVINPNDPKENETTGGTGPLNIDAACRYKTSYSTNIEVKSRKCSQLIFTSQQKNDTH